MYLNFIGPYYFNKLPRIFDASTKARNFIYVWFVNVNGVKYLHYIGETRNIAKRQKEHLFNLLGLNYGIWDVYRKDVKLIWPGFWRLKDVPKDVFKFYKDFNQKIIDYINSISIYFAKFTFGNLNAIKNKKPRNIRRYIEGRIAKYLRENLKQDKLRFYPNDNSTAVVVKGEIKNIIVDMRATPLGIRFKL